MLSQGGQLVALVFAVALAVTLTGALYSSLALTVARAWLALPLSTSADSIIS